MNRYLVVLLASLVFGCASSAKLELQQTTITFPADNAHTEIEVKNNQHKTVNYALELEQGDFISLVFLAVNPDALISLKDPKGNLLYQQHRQSSFFDDSGLRIGIELSGRYLLSISFPEDADMVSIRQYDVQLTKVQRYSVGDVIHISQSACYGRCQVFNGYLFADGHYLMDGEEYTPIIGIVQGQLPVAEVAAVFTAMAKANLARFQNDYDRYNKKYCPTFATDSSTINLTYSTADLVKTISHYRGCYGVKDLDQLEALEKQVSNLFSKHGLL